MGVRGGGGVVVVIVATESGRRQCWAISGILWYSHAINEYELRKELKCRDDKSQQPHIVR